LKVDFGLDEMGFGDFGSRGGDGSFRINSGGADGVEARGTDGISFSGGSETLTVAGSNSIFFLSQPPLVLLLASLPYLSEQPN
jgi:hypothetical protein